MPSHRFKTQQKAVRHNHARALLLKLPGEVLNVIYELMLGGDTVHVWVNKDNKVKTRLCLATEADAQAISTINNAAEQTKIVRHRDRHAQCNGWSPFIPGRKGFPPTFNEPFWYTSVFQFLSTHKLIYNDTKAMPFAFNPFVFSSYDNFTIFEKLLTPFQRDNLTSIVLECGYVPPIKTLTPPQPMMGLKNLTIFYEAALKYDFQELGTDDLERAEGRSSKVLKGFHGCKIKNLEVCITLLRPDGSFADPEALRPLSATLKAKVRAANPTV